MRSTLILFLLLTGCANKGNEAMAQVCGSDWGNLHVGLPEWKLDCAFKGYQPYVKHQTSNGKYYAGFMLHGSEGYVITIDGLVADFGS